MFGIKGRDTFNKPHTTFEEKMQNFASWWVKYFSFVLLILFCMALAVVGYVWYQYLYDKDVSEQEKQDYIIQKQATITFKKEKFEVIEQELEQRREKYDEPKQEYNDIFYNEDELTKDEIIEEIKNEENNILSQQNEEEITLDMIE